MKRGAVRQEGGTYAAWMGSYRFPEEGTAARRADEFLLEASSGKPAAKNGDKKKRGLAQAKASARGELAFVFAACLLVVLAASFFLTMKHLESAQEERIRSLRTKIVACSNENEAITGELLLQSDLSRAGK